MLSLTDYELTAVLLLFQRDRAPCYTYLTSIVRLMWLLQEKNHQLKPSLLKYGLHIHWIFLLEIFLWGYLKDKVHETNLHTLNKLQANIWHLISELLTVIVHIRWIWLHKHKNALLNVVTWTSIGKMYLSIHVIFIHGALS